MQSIKEYKRINGLQNYHILDVPLFLEGKRFKVENVRSDKTRDNIPCMKVDLRIIEDSIERLNYENKPVKNNVGKVITARIDHDGNEAIYTGVREELVDAVGRVATIRNDKILGYFIYQTNCLIINLEDIDIEDEEVAKQNVEKTDRYLNGLNHFKTFNFNKFVSDKHINLFGITKKAKNDLRLNAHVEGSGMFEIKIPVRDVESLPRQLLTLNHSFKAAILKYDVDYISMIKNNTSMMVAMKMVVFAPNILDEKPIQLGIKTQQGGK